MPCHTRPRPHSVSTAFKTVADHQGALCAAMLWKRCEDTLQSPRTSCSGVYFKHAQNKRRGLAFAKRIRQRAVWML